MLEETVNVNINEELEHVKEVSESSAAEYRKMLELSMQSKRNAEPNELVMKMIHTDAQPDEDDSPKQIQELIDYITGPQSGWCSKRNETQVFRQLIQESYEEDWRQFESMYPDAVPTALEPLPPRYVLPPMPKLQMETLEKSHPSMTKPGTYGFFLVNLKYLDLKGRRCSTTREFSMKQSAAAAIEATMSRIFFVTNFWSMSESSARSTSDFMFRVHGMSEFIYGPEALQDFRYIRNCLVKQLQITLTIEPFDSSRMSQPLFFPSYRSLQPPNKTHRELSITDVNKLVDAPQISLWEVHDRFRVVIDELSNLCIPPDRVKGENLRDGDDIYVCLVGELLFGVTPVCPPQCTPWRCCKNLVGASKDTFATAVWGPKGALTFNVKVSDLPRELKLCLSLVAVGGDNFAQVSSYTAVQMLDDSIKGQERKLQKLVNFINPLKIGAEEERLSPTFYLAAISVQLFDHAGKLRSGNVDVRMWPGDQRVNPIGTNAINPDKTSYGLEMILSTYAKPVVYPDGAPPPSKLRDVTLAHADDLLRLDMQIRDNEIAQLRHVKRILATDPLYALTNNDRVLLWKYREELIRRPKALCKLLLAVNWMMPQAVYEAHQLMERWSPMQPMDALELLDSRYADTKVREYAVSIMDSMDDHELSSFILQLVQVLKYEPYHYNALSRFLLRRCLRSPHVIGHYVFWHLVAEMENARVCERHGLLIEEILKRLPKRRELLRQQYVVDQLLAAAMVIKGEAKKDRASALRDQLRNIRFPKKFTLALNPSMDCSGLEIAKCKVMDSKKLPLWLVFRNAQEDGDPMYIIFKAGDDLRQDLLTLQLLSLMDNIWKSAGLDLHMIPYGCVATGEGVGMIEIVLRSDTIANITRKHGGAQAAFRDEPLMDWLRKYNRLPDEVRRCLWNFVYSCAGYTVATYILGIGDRHNDNIMVREDGTLFHIDFGHFLGNFKTKFGFKRETAPFIFTKMYAYMLGGPSSPIYAYFAEVACQAYNVIRRYSNMLIILFMLMLSTGIPELQKVDDIHWLKQVLLVDQTDEEASRHYKKQIQEALENKRTLINDYIHILAH